MLTLAQATDLIRTRCPGWVVDSVATLGEGDFCAAFLVNQDWVFRFAKHQAAATSLLREACLLPRLAAQVDLRIPVPQLVKAERAPVFIAYPMLPGPMLTSAHYLRLGEPARDRCATQLARFLVQLHATDLRLARTCAIPMTDYRASYSVVLARARHSLLPKLAPRERTFVEETVAGYLASEAPTDFRPVLLHGDLSPDHVLYDPGAAILTGVIDFGDTAIGDPAWDFVYLYEDYGADMLGRVVRAYIGARFARPRPLIERITRFVVLAGIAWAVTCAEGASDELDAAIAHLSDLGLRYTSLIDDVVAAGGLDERR